MKKLFLRFRTVYALSTVSRYNNMEKKSKATVRLQASDANFPHENITMAPHTYVLS